MDNPSATSFELSLPFQPIVILGAGRSGTNALRDMLARLPDTTTWPCDEINPIWRFGNSSFPTDIIPGINATQPVRKFIRGAFVAQWRRGGKAKYVIEKTCANTLRLGFVDAVLPEAKFIVITRDGRSVVPSAIKRWRGELEVPSLQYFLAKARFIPVSSIPYVIWRFVSTRIGKIFGGTKLSFWGPRFELAENLTTRSLEHICALQWRACVEATELALSKISTGRILQIRYEDMIAEPDDILSQVVEFMNMELSTEQRDYAAAVVRDFKNQGTGEIKAPSNNRTNSEVTTLEILNPCLAKLGYI